MSSLDAVLSQYEKNTQSFGDSNRMSQEERMKKYFACILPQGQSQGQRRVRILPTPDGSSPFKEVWYHELQVGGKWQKFYDPGKNDNERSPLNEVHDELMSTGKESDKELAKQYKSRKFYIVKVIDRDAEEEGVKFWRFKHNSKGEGILDKIFPLFKNKGDITDPQKGRDLIITLGLTKAGNGKDYTAITSIIPEDQSPLHTDSEIVNSWINDELTWSDVYSKKSEDYLEMVAKGEVPRWDSETKKWVSNSTEETVIGSPSAPSKSEAKAPVYDPQEDTEGEDDLPF